MAGPEQNAIGTDGNNMVINGTGPITLGGTYTITAAAGTLTGATLAAGVTASSLTTVGTLASPVLTTPQISSIVNTGTLTLPTATGTVWASGSINTNTAQTSFLAYRSSSVSNVTGDGTDYKIIFDSTRVNTGLSSFVYSTSTGLFTAPVTGNYFIQVGIGTFGYTSSITDAYVHLYVNGTGGLEIELVRLNGYAVALPGGSTMILNASILINLNASETVQCNLVGSGGSKVVSLIGDGAILKTYMSGFLVC